MSTTTAEKTLIAYHGDSFIKEKYVCRMKAHMLADELVQGTGWESNGTTKGCAVGCTLNAYNHVAYENELGIPKILAHLEDGIFEGLSFEESKNFPLTFLEAIPVGADLSNIFKHFFIWMLTDPADGVIKFVKDEQTKTAIQSVSDLLSKYLLEKVTLEELNVVRTVARKAGASAAEAAAAATSATYPSAEAAYAAAEAADAASAASAAADAAASAAAEAPYAATSYAAACAYYASADASEARRNHFSKMAAKLIELLKAA
jgi:hypothetical protein